ncbi:uncharacterized protein J4E92_004319 [Alternaria infectoria]|uniref:uncharacterized protein n=1 Tax=Alternaria infectoria TaxID=45303 RepID=UPI0022204FCB|nr:uncharacterized protein J4E92_004319 [Alternaria infectoria]KAI4930487.1 hypothetical protein J4E92_004319 [Alternaria infectoria]
MSTESQRASDTSSDTSSPITSDTPVKVLRLGVDGFISSPLIKVLVGPESQRSELFVHQSIITSRSKFFANALSGRWNNSDAKTINLYDLNPELRSEDVEHYLEAVYTNRITLKDDSSVLERICHVYVIAELLLDLHTRNLATQALYEQISFRESYGWCGLGRHGLLQCDDLPKRFLSELATAALKEEHGPLLYHLDTYLEDNS